MEEENKQVYGKKNLWLWVLIYLVIAVVAYAAIYYLFFAKGASSNNAPVSQNNSQAVSKVKFADTSDAQNAYLISIDNYDAKTNEALAGFKVDRKVLSDGTQQINLVAQEAGYQSQSFTVAPGQKLYFVEKFLQDDQNGQERNMGDDKATLVDADGYIVQ